jgi:PleD family two-component response regulator
MRSNVELKTEMVNGSDLKNGMEYRVLVVDDEPMILAAIRKVLQTEGFVIDDADSVPTARIAYGG